VTGAASHGLGGLPRNYLRPCLLLLLAEAPSHGYDLLEQIGQLGMERTDAGGLYRALRAMEQDQLVFSWWEHSDSGPARRTYTLTDEGLDWLHAWAGSLREVSRLLGHYLGRYESLVGEAVPAARS
jgi:poly-beta-hydroxybutyrate-responsive repressor